MDYLNYSDWLWKILVVVDESDLAGQYADDVPSLLATLKDPADIECCNLHDKNPVDHCRRILFILDQSKLTVDELTAIHKWLRSLMIDPKRSEKYMILLIDKGNKDSNASTSYSVDERFQRNTCIANLEEWRDVFTWWPRVICFLCKTRNWDNSAYILQHAGIPQGQDNGSKMKENLAKIDDQKKLIEVMLGRFGPRNLHTAQWNGGSSASRPVTARDVKLLTQDTANTTSEQNQSKPLFFQPTIIPSQSLASNGHVVSRSSLTEEPLKPTWTNLRRFAAVVPVFILLTPDITVAEKCYLTDYARDFPKTQFLCINDDDPPSDYTRLVSNNVYGRREVLHFIFNLLKELKVITSIRSKKKDSCVCTLM